MIIVNVSQPIKIDFNKKLNPKQTFNIDAKRFRKTKKWTLEIGFTS